MDMLQITNLKKSFNEKKVLNGLNLNVPEHSIFGFIGKNGSGKTTTMKTILGFLKADCGEILVNGEKVVYGQTSTNKYIGYLPDVPEFYSFMTAREYLNFCAKLSDFDITESKKRAEELLKKVGLSDEKGKIKGYSRGMKQRLGIAQALLSRPKLLICDEPTSALDPVGRKEILDILLSINDETTILFSTHIISDIERICTDVAFLNNGVIERQGKISEIKNNFNLGEYSIETESFENTLLLAKGFPKMNQISITKLSFNEKKYKASEVLRYIADNNISIFKFERNEPSLESLFVEDN